MAGKNHMFADLVAEEINEVEITFVRNAVKLLDDDNSIPFIARYRKIQTGGMDAERLRQLKRSYETIKAARLKAEKIVDKLGDELSKSNKELILSAKTVEEVNELYAPFKKNAKGTLADRARQHGLELPAMRIIKNPSVFLDLHSYVRRNETGLESIQGIKTAVQHIIADVIAKDEKTTENVKKFLEGQIVLESKINGAKAEADKGCKFKLYYEFSQNVERIMPHQILAINRGEEQQILTVKLEILKAARDRFVQWLKAKWIPKSATEKNRNILCASVDDAFKRLIKKKFLKSIRRNLTKKAEELAIEVFSKNLQRLLLAPPVRGKNILAIDPGFKHGCKLAAVDRHGNLLETSVIYPFGQGSNSGEKKLQDIVRRRSCEVIGIGNGTACRETEEFIANLIRKKMFKPVDVSYCIVNESGASIYSVTKDAETEFPDMDPNLRSAVSIGRRLQDPLLELIKIDPKHLGVGMYQHDVSETLLKGALEGVLEDCVSFVGVDLNASSAGILRRIAGLGAKKAEAIIAWREANGPFINRQQLLVVKGFGKKSFQQCAGFVRVMNHENNDTKPVYDQVKTESDAKDKKRKASSKVKTAAKRRKVENEYKPEPLDQTWIHPESYETTYRLLQTLGLESKNIGTNGMRSTLDQAAMSRINELTETLETDKETLSLIIKGLQQPIGYDIRSEFEQPSFRKELQSIDDLKTGQIVSGIVSNVTSFGVFVNIGVGKDGLIHQSKLNGCTSLGPGDKCQCLVLNVQRDNERIQLGFRKRENLELKLT